MSIQTTATLVCPFCGAKTRHVMPEDACVVVAGCSGCGAQLRPLPGDCCVFCSYADVPCPPVQRERAARDTRPLEA